MGKLRNCLVAPVPPPYGGIGNWVLLLKKHIKQRNDIEIDVVNTAPSARGLDGRTIWDRVVVQGLLIFKKCRELKRIIKKKRPDVIHITTSGQLAVIRDIFLLRIAKGNGIPSVYHIRFGRTKDIAEKNTKEWTLISKAMALATEVMVIDRATYEAVNKYLPSVKAVYVPNPIDLSDLPKPVNRYSKTIVFLGWVIKTKGVEELLQAWRNVYDSNKDWKLKLVGPYNKDYYAYLEDKYSFEGVVFEGEMSHDRAMELLNDSEVFILPSYTEGFPNVVLEAMALAKPIIATAVGAIPDMLSGNCGLIINSKDTGAIEKALTEMISNSERRASMSYNALEKLKNEYSIERIFSKYMEEWLQLSQ